MTGLNKKKVIISWALYIKITKGYTPPYSIEKNYLIATKKRNLLLSKEDQHNQLT